MGKLGALQVLLNYKYQKSQSAGAILDGLAIENNQFYNLSRAKASQTVLE